MITVDHFGNAITNIDSELLSSGGRILVAGRTIKGLTRTYGDAIPPAPIALIGSSGRLEIAIPNGSAASVLGLGPGARVVVEFFDS